MKRFEILAEFPDCPLKFQYQHINLVASNYPVAVKKALEAILVREGVKGQRHHRIKLTVALADERPA